MTVPTTPPVNWLGVPSPTGRTRRCGWRRGSSTFGVPSPSARPFARPSARWVFSSTHSSARSMGDWPRFPDVSAISASCRGEGVVEGRVVAGPGADVEHVIDRSQDTSGRVERGAGEAVAQHHGAVVDAGEAHVGGGTQGAGGGGDGASPRDQKSGGEGRRG